MKLGELRATIRATKGNPFIRVSLAPALPPMNLVLQKGPLLESLELAFPDGKGHETGLDFDTSNGFLTPVESGGVDDDLLA